MRNDEYMFRALGRCWEGAAIPLKHIALSHTMGFTLAVFLTALVLQQSAVHVVAHVVSRQSASACSSISQLLSSTQDPGMLDIHDATRAKDLQVVLL